MHVLFLHRGLPATGWLDKISAAFTSTDFLLHIFARVRLDVHREHCRRGGEAVHAVRDGVGAAVKTTFAALGQLSPALLVKHSSEEFDPGFVLRGIVGEVQAWVIQ